MPKFSIIVPVYNVEDYIEKCLDSICNQTFEDFEVIVVNDGTKDNSGYFIDEFAKKDKRIRSFKKRNGGLSSARNFGVKKARGAYILFVDSDDYIEKDLLKKLNTVIEKNKDLELIRFQINEVNEYTGITKKLDSTVFDICSGEEGFVKLTTNSLLEPAWAYAYKSDFFKKYNFMYASGKLHEDFGLTPYIIVKAKKMCSIDYYGYNYLIRENSIMTSASEDKLIARANDTLYHFDNLLKWIDEDKGVSEDTKKVFRSFIANVLISKSIIVPKAYLKFYIKELKKRNISKYLLSNNIPRLVKKLVIKFDLDLYINKVARKIS